MPIHIEFTCDDGQTETMLTDLGQITTFYDFTEHDMQLVVASAMQLRYYGKLAIFRCGLQDTIKDLSVVHMYSPILSSHIPEATQDEHLKALPCGEDETYETTITNPKGQLTVARFSLFDEEIASELGTGL